LPAAIASECAAEQGRFFQYADALFARGGVLSTQTLAALVTPAGVQDSLRFANCLANSQDARARVVADTTEASAIHITSTPTTVLGHRLYVGAMRPMLIERLLTP
jgi:protein-disulfide isomerase